MENYKVKLNLMKLRNTVVEDVKYGSESKRCVVIPIEDNNLFVSQKSNSVYLDMTAYTCHNDKYGQSHVLKQKLGGKAWATMTDDERRNIPIAGSLQVDENRNNNNNNNNGGYRQYNNNNPQPSTSQSNGGFAQTTSSSDLPF